MSNTIQLFNKNYNVYYHYQDLTTIWELQSYLSITDLNRYNQLKEDITQNGVIDPILYYATPDGIKLVIDGHIRLKACIELEISDIPKKEIRENFALLSDVQFWMVKHQCQRRNLTPVEKLKFACLHEETIVKKAKENLSKAGRGDNVKDKIDTILEISKLAGIGRTTTARYRSVINSGFYGIIGQMMQESLSITTAYNQVQDKLKLKEMNIIPEIEDKLNSQQKCQSRQKCTQSEIQEPKYVNDVNAGTHLLRDNEIEYFIMTKDEAKVKDFLSQQLNSKCAVFIMED
ncbi:ParB N-terminal domain-containing protein [uncultured Chryseobacterium sp.]|uniref:ParB N-terminal domain-containing protein n=1 Tax=uncultured Chryseobacterium sp. TaxID=259322 RepID=UPI0025F4E1BD|nr:ParB N-terminal domain-containing protein [uncultured Chryseobacterium sp.]